MSEDSGQPSRPQGDDPRAGKEERAGNGQNNSRRPYRRRFYHSNNQSGKGDNRTPKEAQPGDPLASDGVSQNQAAGQNPPSQNGANQNRQQQNQHGGRRGQGQNQRAIPDRDRGPRRGSNPPPAQPSTAEAKGPERPGEAKSGEPPVRNGNPNQNQQRGRRGRPANQGRQRQPNGRQQNPQADNRPENNEERPGQRGPRPNNRPQQNPNAKGAKDNGKPGRGLQKGQAVRKPRPANRQGIKRQGQEGENPFVYVKPPPIKTSTGIKARSQEGQYALSWWAARWITAMENLVDGRRLGRGRSYAKDGQVLSIEEKPGGVTALVQGSRPKPYRVSIEIIPLADFEWEKVFDVLASQALFAAQLLAGEMPRNIEEAFDAAGTSLFPARLGDLHTDCTCPDWANPCKHVAATHYILAERFDEDPFLLFRLRGRTSEQILAALRERRAGPGDEPLLEEPPLEETQPVQPLSSDPEGFFHLSAPLDDFSLSFKAPQIEMAVIKRLGDPNFLGQESLIATLEPVFRAVRSAALEAALGEAGGEEEDSNGSSNKAG